MGVYHILFCCPLCMSQEIQILLTFNRLQVMYSVFSIVLKVEVAYKGLFLT